jgi:orotidine-5'-phosphate decarboxylase
MMFRDKLAAAQDRNRSLLCVGLDPDPALMPIQEVAAFNMAIIEATSDLVCAYKPNMAFYEALSLTGLRALEVTLAHIPPHIPVILDAKRGDVGNTAAAYARALFERFGCDAVTVNPYGGHDSIEPFLTYRDKGVFLWCRSSNPGAADFQDLPTQFEGEMVPFYQAVASQAVRWNTQGNVGLIVGATYPAELAAVRAIAPDLPILLPGIWAQQGELQAAVAAGRDARGGGLIVSASRSILYAYKEGEPSKDYAQAARDAAAALRDAIEEARLGQQKQGRG